MKTKIQDLTDAQANEWCARAQEWKHHTHRTHGGAADYWTGEDIVISTADYTPTTNGAQAFELIEKFKPLLVPLADDGQYTGEWEAAIASPFGSSWGYSPARAIVNAVISSVYGGSVEIEEITDVI